MKNLEFYRRVFACLMIISVFVTFGCRDKSSDQTDSNTIKPTISDSSRPDGRRPLDSINLGDANQVAVTVNGVDIQEGEINAIIAPQLEMLANSPGISDISADALNEDIKLFREEVLQQLIVKSLLDPKIKDANTVVTTEDAENIIMQELSAQSSTASIEKFKETLAIYGRDYDEEIERIIMFTRQYILNRRK